MSRFNFCDCPAGFNADPERHAPDCPGRSCAGKRGPTPVPATIKRSAVEPSVQRFWSEEARNIRCVRAEDFDAHVTRLQAENAALQQRLNVADQRVDELEDAATVASMRIRELDLTFGRYLLGMKAAVIADESGGNGMEWIFNGLAGPGELPPEDERDAQAYFDREVEGIDAGLSEVFAFHDARRKASQVKP